MTRWTGQAVVMALVTFVTVSSAAAETLMMPKRDARMGTQVVVWGVHTQAGSPACTIDFGDASPVANCTGADRSYIAFGHTYATQGTFTATLTVGAEVATVNVRVFDVALLPGGATGEANRGLGINMAIQDGLRYLWTSQSNRAGNFPAGTATNWTNGWSSSEAALVTLAFENHGYRLANDGSAPTGLYEKYIVRRGLNYVIASFSTVNLASQPSGIAGQPVRDPCVGAGIEASPCIGLHDTRQDVFHESYTTAVAILPLAASGALSRVNTEVGGYTSGRTYGEILQRATNALSWGQIDVNNASRGGWFYNFNSSSSDGSTIGWDLLAMLDSAAAGAVVPAWVNSEFAFALTGGLNNDGSLDYQADGNPASNGNVGPQKNGIGLQGLAFIGETTGARVTAVTNNVSSWWAGAAGIGGNSWGGCSNLNKGCGYTMFNNFKGLKLHGITTLPGVTRPAGPGAIAAGDWYADYQDFLVSSQSVPSTTGGGAWPAMGFSCCNSGQQLTAAIAELILSPVALVLPDADKFGAFGLSPATNTALELTAHTVTAKAESTGGTPVAGATVNFVILTGPNAGLTGTDTTDSNGEATFTYTDAGPEGTIGTDTIQASIGSLESNIVEMTWLPLNAPPVAEDDAGATFSGTPVTVNVLVNDGDPDFDLLTVTSVTQGANGSVVDNGDGTVTYTPNLGFAGIDTFTYEISDGKGGTDTATVTITVIKRALTVTANSYTRSYLAPDPTLEGTLVGVATGDAITATYSSPGTGSQVPGVHATIPALVDPGGKLPNYDVTSVNGTLTITNTAPVCTIVPSITSIWPPNHKWVPVTASGATDVDGGPLTYTVVSIFQDEPVDGHGDGHTGPDGKGVGTDTAWVRAERMGKSWKGPKSGKGSVKSKSSSKSQNSGKSSSSSKSDKGGGNGRVYHITFTVTDSLGLTCTATVQVGVPHDQSGPAAVDDGALYDSTVAPPKSVKSAKSNKSTKAPSAKSSKAASTKAPAKAAPKGKGKK